MVKTILVALRNAQARDVLDVVIAPGPAAAQRHVGESRPVRVHGHARVIAGQRPRHEHRHLPSRHLTKRIVGAIRITRDNIILDRILNEVIGPIAGPHIRERRARRRHVRGQAPRPRRRRNRPRHEHRHLISGHYPVRLVIPARIPGRDPRRRHLLHLSVGPVAVRHILEEQRRQRGVTNQHHAVPPTRRDRVVFELHRVEPNPERLPEAVPRGQRVVKRSILPHPARLRRTPGRQPRVHVEHGRSRDIVVVAVVRSRADVEGVEQGHRVQRPVVGLIHPLEGRSLQPRVGVPAVIPVRAGVDQLVAQRQVRLIVRGRGLLGITHHIDPGRSVDSLHPRPVFTAHVRPVVIRIHQRPVEIAELPQATSVVLREVVVQNPRLCAQGRQVARRHPGDPNLQIRVSRARVVLPIGRMNLAVFGLIPPGAVQVHEKDVARKIRVDGVESPLAVPVLHYLVDRIRNIAHQHRADQRRALVI